MNELLKPRIKVIAPMPLMKNEVGSLLYRHDLNDTFSFGIKTEDAEHFYKQEDFKKWPHIFKELPWWEDRQESEMPEYVKNISTNKFFKVKKWRLEFKRWQAYHNKSDLVSTQATWLIPATLEEYQSQKL